MPVRLHSVFALVLLLGVTPASAHPGGHAKGSVHDARSSAPFSGDRYWTDQRTGRVLVGGFLAERNGQVAVELRGGGVERLSLSDLSGGDQARVRERRAWAAALNHAKVDGHSVAVAARTEIPWLPLGLCALGLMGAAFAVARHPRKATERGRCARGFRWAAPAAACGVVGSVMLLPALVRSAEA